MDEFSDGYEIHNAKRPPGRIRRVLCWIGWHRPDPLRRNYDDIMREAAYCRYCGRRILRGRHGDWFAERERP